MKNCQLRINDNIIVNNMDVADTFLTRLKGLMFKKEMPENYGLMIYPCNSIHMFFMNFPIDVLFVNDKDEIIDFLEDFQINKISKIYNKAKYVIELPSGTIKNKKIEKNMKLFFSKP